MSPFVSSSGLSPGSREARVQRAKVCLNCTEPSVARSSCWSLPVVRYLSDTRCKVSMVVLVRWTASNMAEELQTSISHQVRERWTTMQWFLWLPHLTHGEYMVSSTSRSCVVPMCQTHRGERAGTLWWPKSRTHTSKLAHCMSYRGVTWFPAWCLTSRSSSPTYSYRMTELSQSDAGPPFCCHLCDLEWP